MARKSKNKNKNKPSKKVAVNFFAGIKTPSKEDDRQVSFIATKNSNILEAPKELSAGIPLGMAEVGGLQFDSAFGLGGGEDPKNPFTSKIGIDPNFGLGKGFDVNFTKGFANQKFDFGESTMISNDYEEPSVDKFEEDYSSSVPKLLESMPTIGKKIPLTDEEAEQNMKTKRKRELISDSGFENVRAKQLLAGDTPISADEAYNFQQGRGYRGQLI